MIPVGPLTGRLTDAGVWEKYLECGNAERCTDTAILGIALPNAFKTQSAVLYFVILVYGLGLVVIVPSLVGSWWTQIRITDEGLHLRTANLFFKFCMDKKGASFQDLIWLFCLTEEIQQEVQLVEDDFHISLACGKTQRFPSLPLR
jgi:preprotein translocase subunit Sec63